MPYRPLRIPAGVSRRNTEAQAGVDGRYWDSNLVRSRGELIVPVGGWKSRSAEAVTGSARAILAWEANNGARHIAIGLTAGSGGVKASNQSTRPRALATRTIVASDDPLPFSRYLMEEMETFARSANSVWVRSRRWRRRRTSAPKRSSKFSVVINGLDVICYTSKTV